MFGFDAPKSPTNTSEGLKEYFLDNRY